MGAGLAAVAGWGGTGFALKRRHTIRPTVFVMSRYVARHSGRRVNGAS